MTFAKNRKSGVKYDLRVGDITRLYGYGETYVRKLTRDGVLPGVRVGATYRYNSQEVADAIEAYSEKIAEKQARHAVKVNLWQNNNTEHIGMTEPGQDDEYSNDIDDIDLGI